MKKMNVLGLALMVIAGTTWAGEEGKEFLKEPLANFTKGAKLAQLKDIAVPPNAMAIRIGGSEEKGIDCFITLKSVAEHSPGGHPKSPSRGHFKFPHLAA